MARLPVATTAVTVLSSVLPHVLYTEILWNVFYADNVMLAATTRLELQKYVEFWKKEVVLGFA